MSEEKKLSKDELLGGKIHGLVEIYERLLSEESSSARRRGILIGLLKRYKKLIESSAQEPSEAELEEFYKKATRQLTLGINQGLITALNEAMDFVRWFGKEHRELLRRK